MNSVPHSSSLAARLRQRPKFPPLWLSLTLSAVLLLLLWPRERAYLQAACILSQLDGQQVPKLLRPVAALPVTTQTLTIASAAGAIPARLYTPVHRPHAPGMVIVPGIHYLGMNEPRLVAFANSMAGCGLRVLTPELPDSRDYRITPSDVAAIGDAVQWLRQKSGRRVGLMGLSFSGGLALMAAAQPPYSNDVSLVFTVGAHDDLYRVAMFYVTGADPLPGGDVERVPPNTYGPLVLEYEHIADFLSVGDIAPLQTALRARLYEDPALEKKLVDFMTPAQQADYKRLVDVQRQESAIAASNNKNAPEMAQLSPHGHLAGLHVPVYLLHGRGDDLIPFAEAIWLARDLPHGTVADLLVTPLIAHVGPTRRTPGLYDEWRLLHLMAQVLERAEHE